MDRETQIQWLEEAWALIDTPDKWYKGAEKAWKANGDPMYCSFGAVMEVVESHHDPDNCFSCAERSVDLPHAGEANQVAQVLMLTIPAELKLTDGLSSITTYNDLESTTHEDIRVMWGTALMALKELG